MLRKLALSALAVAAVAVPVAGAAGHPSVKITSATASGKTIVVHVKIGDWKMYPSLVGKKPNHADGGHWHIYVDGKYEQLLGQPDNGEDDRPEAGRAPHPRRARERRPLIAEAAPLVADGQRPHDVAPNPVRASCAVTEEATWSARASSSARGEARASVRPAATLLCEHPFGR